MLNGESRQPWPMKIGPSRNGPPDEAHAPLFGERADPERRRIGIGARELVPELGARHRASLKTCAILARARAQRKRRGTQKSRPIRGMGRPVNLALLNRRDGSALRRFGRGQARLLFFIFFFADSCGSCACRLLHRVLGAPSCRWRRGRSGRVGLGDRGERGQSDCGADADCGQCLQHFTFSMTCRSTLGRGGARECASPT